jgi:hypothetical protein
MKAEITGPECENLEWGGCTSSNKYHFENLDLVQPDVEDRKMTIPKMGPR